MESLIQVQLFDGMDNRKFIQDCFVRMGRNLTEQAASERRAGFLQGMSDIAGGYFGDNPIIIDGFVTAAEAYFLFIEICARIGKPIEEAANLLERAVKWLEDQPYGAPLVMVKR